MSNITLKDRQLYMSKIPDILQNDANFKVFLELAITEFNIDLAKIESFTDLIDPDKVPIEFIQELGSVVGFEKNYNAGEFNREILTRVQSIYSQRGTTDSILMAANHGGDSGWVGGQLFIPGYGIGLEECQIVMATDKIFTHSRSKFSGGDKYSNKDMYRPGVIIITVPYLDSTIRTAILKNTPAGVRLRYISNGVFIPNIGESGSHNELSIYKYFKVAPITPDEISGAVQPSGDVGLTICMYASSYNNDSNLVHSAKFSKRKHSGGLIMISNNSLDIGIGASLLSSGLLNSGFDTTKGYLVSASGEKIDTADRSGTDSILHDINKESFDVINRTISLTVPKRSSSSGKFSGRNALSGAILDRVENFVTTGGDTPSEFIGYVSDIENLRPADLFVSSVGTSISSGVAVESLAIL